ncbi:phosphocholine-specific phospholipase C [Brevundimonas sp. FT23042]|uniref:phosphocholine-specific phospholipase C n=1 Tax=Brevundimonas sp. FT23042 TaxID=3393749 RepID=UPI003B5862BD
MDLDRRRLLAAAGAGGLMLPAIARAMSIPADVRSGAIDDVDHVVILMQENRSFDHYFGAFRGVRGFGDRFPIPLADTDLRKGRTCWVQANPRPNDAGRPPLVSPFALNTTTDFRLMRVEGTPHSWPDAQAAWDEGRMSAWPVAKTEHSMGYYREEDIPWQYALADAFTLCDAYHCSIQTGTNSNRLFLWSGTNDPSGLKGGPSISNSHDRLVEDGGHPDGYRWSTYPERLQAAGVSWRIYQDMADNFTDNPVAGFQAFRDSHAGAPGSDPELAARGLSTRHLDGLREDVLSGTLPRVSWIVAPAADSEHPSPSSPAQGADYTARVIDALTADPAVWARTVLFLTFDENDGFFDHMPPPAPPSRAGRESLESLGGSTVSTAGEHHLETTPSEARTERPEFMGRPYGLGPRVPMYVLSPWSRGGWVNSQVFDHTSVIRFLETRFGVMEPNISPWRRAVCGDLTSAFDFRTPNAPFPTGLPETGTGAARAAALPGRTAPTTPSEPGTPVQAAGHRPSRALPYALDVEEQGGADARGLRFRNDGAAGAVFHVYDRLRLDRAPRRYTVGAGDSLSGLWDPGAYDLWVLGPNGFHRHLIGDALRPEPVLTLRAHPRRSGLELIVANPTDRPLTLHLDANAYQGGAATRILRARPGGRVEWVWPVADSGGWYDLSVRCPELDSWSRRVAGRLETGADSISDPAMGGPAILDQV